MDDGLSVITVFLPTCLSEFLGMPYPIFKEEEEEELHQSSQRRLIRFSHFWL
jgi:hypothetical protein